MGRPDKIRIELARGLRMNAKKRKESTKKIADATRKNETIRKRLKEEYHIPRPGRNDIIKYKLAEETNWQSLYSGKQIKSSELFTNAYEIEHIIPKSRMYDDSFMNKTLCESRLNREKSNQTAYDYLKSKGDEAFNKYVSSIKDNKKIPKPKQEKLLMGADRIPDDFINRQLSETHYITKKAKDLLLSTCRNVTVTSGTITNLLKEQWGLKYVLEELNLEKYRNIGQTEHRDIKTNGGQFKSVERIFRIDKSGNKIFWSKRDDHRHHALDAIIVAFTRPKYIRHLNTLNATFEERYQGGKDLLAIAAQSFDPPRQHLRQDILKSLSQTLISFKRKNKVVTSNKNRTKTKIKWQENIQITLTPRGQLHKETVYGNIKRIKETAVKLNSRFDTEQTQLIVNSKVKNLVELHLEKFDNDPKKAFSAKSLKTTPVIYKGNILEKVQCYENIYVVRKEVDDQLNIENVIDKGIKRILEQRLDQFEGNKKKAFSNLEQNPIYMNKDQNIQIKRIRVKSRYSDLIDIGRGYVNQGKNHHIALYEDKEGKIHGEKITYLEAVERVKQNLPIVKKQHESKWKYLYHLQINDYFVFFDEKLTSDTDLLDENKYSLIVPKLWKVQSLSILGSGTPYLEFTHQYATEIDKKNPANYKRITTYANLIGKCQKVQVNSLGKIIKIGEY
ncbi:MAG: hypothetical protein GKR88_05870 [Flavobacteriaceae bacterium]|nr:MAG: hypothetical protein GKR88_05870 [Flavobacteriaceae bacterium]